MFQPTDGSLGWPDKPRAIALVVLACISGFIVWSFHHVEMLAFIATLVVGSFAGFLAGGLVGVHVVPSLAMMFVFVGLFEGLVRGWSYGGLFGATLGGPTGVVSAVVICMLPLMLVHLVLVLCRIDPLASTSSATEVEVSEKVDDQR